MTRGAETNLPQWAVDALADGCPGCQHRTMHMRRDGTCGVTSQGERGQRCGCDCATARGTRRYRLRVRGEARWLSWCDFDAPEFIGKDTPDPREAMVVRLDEAMVLAGKLPFAVDLDEMPLPPMPRRA